jgi:hypothetical protein
MLLFYDMCAKHDLKEVGVAKELHGLGTETFATKQ